MKRPNNNIYPVKGEFYPVKGEFYPVKGEFYPVKGEKQAQFFAYNLYNLSNISKKPPDLRLKLRSGASLNRKER